MGKFINLLVPDYIFKADDNENKVVKLFMACAAIYIMMCLFLKFVNVMTGGQDVEKWALWIPIFLVAILCSVLGYIGLLVISYLIVRYPIYWSMRLLVPLCHRLYKFLSEKVRRIKVAETEIPEQAESADTIDQEANAGSDEGADAASEQDEEVGEDSDEEDEVQEIPSFKSLLKCEEPDELVSAINKMTEVNDDKMFFLSIILLLIQHDKLSYRNMNAKEIHCSLVQDFGSFLSYSHFQSQWRRLREHNFKPQTIEDYESNRRYYYNDYDKDYDKYCRAGKKLKESGFI